MQITAKAATGNPLDLKNKRMTKFYNERILHLMILPSVIAVILFSYFPMYGIIIAFKNFNIFKGIFDSPWARNYGFEHFIDLFNSPMFGLTMRNTIVIAILKLVLLSTPSIILAIMLSEIPNGWYKKINQTISYLPHFLSWIILGGIMFTLLSPMPDAPLNNALLSMGLIDKPLDIINNPGLFWPLLVLSDLWKGVGWGSILYLAVIASIDGELFDAVSIDGGGRWMKIRHVTLPAIQGTFVILFILACGGIMSGGGETFDQIFVLSTAQNRSASLTLDLYVLRTGIDAGRFSFATATGLFKTVINFGLLLSADYISKRMTDKGLF